MDQKTRLKLLVGILAKKINDRSFSTLTTNDIIEEMITTLEFKNEEELISWLKSAKFDYDIWVSGKYLRGVKELGRLNKGRIYDSEYGDRYDLFTPDVLIQLYLKEGKGLKMAIDLSYVLFWENLKDLRKLGHDLIMRKKFFK